MLCSYTLFTNSLCPLLTRSFDIIVVNVNGWPLLLQATRCVHRNGSLLGPRSYPINPNLQNSAQVHNTIRAEWDCFLCEQEIFYDEMVSYKLPVPWWLASQMPRDTIEELHRALCHIREESNRMKIHLNRYWTQVEIRELVVCMLHEHARYMQSLLAADIYKLDVEISDEE